MNVCVEQFKMTLSVSVLILLDILQRFRVFRHWTRFGNVHNIAYLNIIPFEVSLYTLNLLPILSPIDNTSILPISADLSSAQCIPAPLATPIPVSDDPATPVVTPCADLSESPSSQGQAPMPYSVPVSEHMDTMEGCSVMNDQLDSLLDCIPKKVSEVRVGWRERGGVEGAGKAVRERWIEWQAGVWGVSRGRKGKEWARIEAFHTCFGSWAYMCIHVLIISIPPPLPPQSPVQGAIPTNLPNTAVGLRSPYASSLPAPSPQLPPAYFSSSVSQMSPLEPYPPLGQREQREQSSSQVLDVLGSFSQGAVAGVGEAEGKAGVGGLDSLSEYTLPGKLLDWCDQSHA